MNSSAGVPGGDNRPSGFWTFWSTLPGVLTGLAGLLGAVAGLVALTTNNAEERDENPSANASDTELIATDDIVASDDVADVDTFANSTDAVSPNNETFAPNLDTVPPDDGMSADFQGLTAQGTVVWNAHGTEYVAFVQTDGPFGSALVEYQGPDGFIEQVRQTLTLMASDGSWFYTGSDPTFEASGLPALTYSPDSFALAETDLDFWEIVAVCDILTGCHEVINAG